MQTLLLLGSKKALEQLTKGQPTIGNDFKVVAGRHVDNITEDAGAAEHSDAICYSLADGAIVDFTINGRSPIIYISSTTSPSTNVTKLQSANLMISPSTARAHYVPLF